MKAGTAAGGECTFQASLSCTSEDKDDIWGVDNTYSNTYQEIDNDIGAITICKVEVYIQTTTQATTHIEIWNYTNATSTLVSQSGDDSDQTVFGVDDDGVWKEFTWSGTEPTPSGDFAVCLLEESGEIAWYSESTESCHGGEDYELYAGGSYGQDFAVKVYTK